MINIDLSLDIINKIASIGTACASVWISFIAYQFNRRESHRDLAKDLQENRDKVYAAYHALVSSIVEEKEDTTYLVDMFHSNSIALINAIEASSTAQPQLTNWLHALDGQINVVRLMRSRLSVSHWSQQTDSTDDTKWASALMNLLLDVVKDSVTPLTPAADDLELLDENFMLVLDNPALINGGGKAKPTIDPKTFEQVRTKWLPKEMKQGEQKLRLQTLVDYKVIAENAIAFILYGELIYRPEDQQERFEKISMIILDNLFKRFSSLASKQINAVLNSHKSIFRRSNGKWICFNFNSKHN
ncbi:hypothetical protein [Bifidobacterium sp. ESL0827]|uniref:hypothetical protein n=1 Tax=Bifidobacterium sp. ESL0827 TaxID=3448583 RepID=UPI004041DB9D